MQIGLLLPHFSDECSWERLIGFSPEIERLGFDSVWARDHLSFEPGPFDPPGNRFIDPFITLSTIAGATSQLRLGFAVAVPFRHPLVTAQLAGSLEWVSRGRVEMGLGIGGPPKQFDVTGIAYGDRIALCEDTAAILRLSADESPFDFEGRLTKFRGACISPALRAETPVWYGGYSMPALRRSVRFCSGIMPGRCAFRDFDPAVRSLRELGERAGRQMLVGSAPFLCMGRNRAEALEKVGSRMQRLLAPRQGESTTSVEDLAGALIAGSPSECAGALHEFLERKVDCVVLDARLVMDEFIETVRLLATEVLPQLN